MGILRIVGDVHGNLVKYQKIVSSATYSVCVGDVGLRYDNLVHDAKVHKFVPGNHDNYQSLPPHSLGDFGVHKVGDLEIFFVRGAWSVDQNCRTPYVDWWPNEELNNREMADALQMYMDVKPSFVITHDAPKSIIELMQLPPFDSGWVRGPERTPRLLDMMWNFHQPKSWVFGHFHKSWQLEARGTRFVCLNVLQSMDVEVG